MYHMSGKGSERRGGQTVEHQRGEDGQVLTGFGQFRFFYVFICSLSAKKCAFSGH